MNFDNSSAITLADFPFKYFVDKIFGFLNKKQI
jgi:hypothetical protein